jgi:hypothetical protein
MENFCAMVNEIINWRHALGDAITQQDYIDFSVPKTEEELEFITNEVNDSFASFNMDLRVAAENGVLVPRVREAS